MSWQAGQGFPGQGVSGQGFSGQGQWPGGPNGWQQPVFLPPKPRRSYAPLILGALVVIGLAMIGLILYSLLAGPDYQNDDYVAPPPGATVPLPDLTRDEVQAVLTANELYAQSVPEPVRCELPHPDFDVPSATDEEVTAYIDDLMVCTMRVWNPPFQATNRWELTRPKVNVYGESITTPCGGGKKLGPNGVYCSANQEVYFSRSVERWQRPHIIDDVMAHEFGHNIQARSSILYASIFMERSVDRAAALEMSRRTELQADCFEGLFMRSVYQSRGYTDQQLAEIRQSVHDDGDDAAQKRAGVPVEPDGHGTSESRVYWWSLGLTGSDVGRCNTFKAPPDHVR